MTHAPYAAALHPDSVKCSTLWDPQAPTLHLRITAPVQSVRVTVPTGPHAGDLTEATDSLAPHTPEWTLQQAGHGLLDAHPIGAPAAHTELALGPLLVNAEPGTVEITVSATLDDGTTHTTRHHLTKDTNDFVIARLAPAVAEVGHGKSVKLTWDGPKGKPTYTLLRSDKKAVKNPIAVNDKNGTCDYTVDDLTNAATAFLLKAAGPNNKEAHAATAVHVTLGDVQAGALSANGHTTLMRTPTAAWSATAKETKCYRAATDGFVTATVTTRQDNTRATLRISVSRPGKDSQPAVERVLHADSAQIPVNAQLPLPAGAELQLALSGDSPSGQAAWFALGGGDLTEQTCGSRSAGHK
ncbi:hypothetical protein [Streptomyces sp. NPDC017529]|uniref:hypothetical protein n=1 Tax=Streptomyces sp. NPDC017529 TaxID=3365000 RepID=UPI0037901FC7